MYNIWIKVADPEPEDKITADTFLEIAKYGCSWCGKDIKITDNYLYLPKDEVILCNNCII